MNMNIVDRFRRGPDRGAALSQYRWRSSFYDMEMALIEPVREQAIAELALRSGETVLDVGCGTGLSFELLEEGVGPGGRIVGIEQSPEMIEQARERIDRHRWKNAELVCAPVEEARIGMQADAALFHFTHDILRQPEAIANVVRHLKPGARVVASGLKWADPWAWPANFFVLPAALHSVTSFEGLSQPWDKLGLLLEGVTVRTTLLGGGFIASGVVAANAKAR
jgi:SAM-dependent methyltransferase